MDQYKYGILNGRILFALDEFLLHFGSTKGSPWIPQQYSTVCGLHFSEKDFKPGTKYRILKEDAVPTVFPSYPEYHKSRLRIYRSSPKCSNANEIQDVKIGKAMSSKDEDQVGDDVSRFTLDGVVAEMVIEVEENEQSPTKPSNVKKVGKEENLKSSAVALDSKEDPENESSSTSKNGDLTEREECETHEAKSDEELEKTPSKMNTDEPENKEAVQESEDSSKNKGDNDVCEENKNSEESKKKELVESKKTEEKELESANDTHVQPKKSRGRPKKKTAEELKNETNEEAKTSALKSKDSQPSANTSLKRSNKEETSEDENDEVPKKKLRSSGEDNTPKRPKRSVTFSPVAIEVDLNKRPSLRKTTILKATQTPSKSTPTTSKATPASSKTTTTSSKTTPASSKGTPASIKGTPASSKGTPVSSKGTPVSSKGTPASSRGRPASSKTTPTSSKTTPTSSKETPVSSKAKTASSKALPSSGKDKLIPTAVDSAFKPWDLDPERIYSLENFLKIKKQVNLAEIKTLKCLHNILYNKVLPKDVKGKDLRKEILKFKGYPFKKSSDAYKKHQTVLEKMPDSTIAQIANILDRKEENISDIMSFLLKPSMVIYCEMDPHHPSMQPVLKLQKITLDTISSSTSSDDGSNNEPFSSEDTLATSKRKRFPSTKLRFYEGFDLPASKKKSQETEKASSKHGNVKRPSASTVATKATSHKAQKAKKFDVKKPNFSVRIGKGKKTKQRYTTPPSQTGIVKKPISSDLQVRRRALELAIEIQETVNPTEEEEANELNENEESALASFEYEQEIKEEVVTEDESENQEKSMASIPDTTEDNESKSENSSSEVTLSADEAREATQEETPQKKRFYKPPVIPLKSFPSIKENILKSDYSALQRLHIVLFGASDKAANLRGNILSFGGFPFYEGSEEWKQKEFLLSLLSQSTLKEYLDILDIKYRDGNQRLLIKKLMKFCAAPIEQLPEDDIEDDDDDMEMEVVSLDEIVPIETLEPPIKDKKSMGLPKKPRKPVPEKKPPRYRKVLMDEAQVRRLEADLAREQRILEREKKLHDEQARKLRLSQWNKSKPAELVVKQPVAENQTDTELLNALMETVYQRRELKKAGAKVSIPNKGGHTRLGELANVKFLVVTANYNDLDVLHHLIYMTEANKSRVRKNILDFAGFNFTEESPAYQDRMNFLTSLGYDISRRIAFLLGLCPYKTLIAQQDLNELIMYFLMSPCQSKQVPIRHLPTTFFGNDMPVELSALVQKHSGDLTVSPVQESASRLSNKVKNTLQITASEHQPSPSQGQRTPGPRAKKSFRSSFTSSKMKGLTPSISTLPLKTPEKLVNHAFVTPKAMLSAIKPPPTLLTQQTIKIPTSQGTPAQEFYIQQQTPDGQQKTFKLVKLPPNHPLNNVLKNQVPQPLPATPEIQPQPITITPPVIGAPGLPPGLIVFKNNPTNPALSSVMQTVPLAIGQSTEKIINPLLMPNIPGMNPVVLPKLGDNSRPIAPKPTESMAGVLPDEKVLDVPVECNYSSDEEAEELHPLEDDNPPTDEEIFGSIQDIIHSCPSLEDITLRNVISRVSAKYPNVDLTPQHYFMKECVKKIIMGT